MYQKPPPASPGEMLDIWKRAAEPTDVPVTEPKSADNGPYKPVALPPPELRRLEKPKPEWREQEVTGGADGELEIRTSPKDKRYVLVTADSRNQVDKSPIPPGETRSLHFTSAIPWTGVAFSVPADLAPHFDLVSLQCARIEFVAGYDGASLPCSIFSDAACADCRLEKVRRHLPTSWPTLYPGTSMRVTVKNTSAEPRHFRGTFEAEPIHSHPCL